MTKFILILAMAILSACQNQKQYTIYTIGDSTMADKTAEVYPETGWCQVLDSYFDESVIVKNHAVNGCSSKSFIDGGRWEAILKSLQPGDFLFIQFGHNDQKESDSTRYTTPFGTYTENLEKFVAETRQKGAAPVLFTSIVRRKFGYNGKLTDTHGDYPTATRQVAERLGVPLIDLQKISEKWANQLGDDASKSMFMWTAPDEEFPEGRKDDTHLSVTGANEIARYAMGEATNQHLAFAKNLKKRECKKFIPIEYLK